MQAEFLGQFRDGFFSLQMSSDVLSFLFGRKVKTCSLSHGIILQSGHANPTRHRFQFQLNRYSGYLTTLNIRTPFRRDYGTPDCFLRSSGLSTEVCATSTSFCK